MVDYAWLGEVWGIILPRDTRLKQLFVVAAKRRRSELAPLTFPASLAPLPLLWIV
jgi:hypothetical protein